MLTTTTNPPREPSPDSSEGNGFRIPLNGRDEGLGGYDVDFCCTGERNDGVDGEVLVRGRIGEASA